MICCDDPTYVLRDESSLDSEIDNLGSSAETRAGFIKGEVGRADTHLYGRFTSWLLLFFLQIFSNSRRRTRSILFCISLAVN